MIVYLASRGEMHEGGTVIAVFETFEEAERAALATKRHFGGGWEPHGSHTGRKRRWVNGCDFVMVEEYLVRRKALT